MKNEFKNFDENNNQNNIEYQKNIELNQVDEFDRNILEFNSNQEIFSNDENIKEIVINNKQIINTSNKLTSVIGIIVGSIVVILANIFNIYQNIKINNIIYNSNTNNIEYNIDINNNDNIYLYLYQEDYLITTIELNNTNKSGIINLDKYSYNNYTIKIIHNIFDYEKEIDNYNLIIKGEEHE